MNAHKSDLVLHYEAADCIAELEQQNLALTAAIKEFRSAEGIANQSPLFWGKFEKLLSKSYPDLLAKHDAELLREIVKRWGITFYADGGGFLETLAAARESGEWKPELGVK